MQFVCSIGLKGEEPPWPASNNLLGSFMLSKFAGHGKPSIRVSFVPDTKCNCCTTDLVGGGKEKKEKNQNQPATMISPESCASIRQHTPSRQRSASSTAKKPKVCRQSPAFSKLLSLPAQESSSSHSPSCSTA